MHTQSPLQPRHPIPVSYTHLAGGQMEAGDDLIDGGDIHHPVANVNDRGEGGRDQMQLPGGNPVMDALIRVSAARIPGKETVLGKTEFLELQNDLVGIVFRIINQIDG